ncbi:MAG: UshA-like (seleno)protein [Desulfurivibrionaceae bacterium]
MGGLSKKATKIKERKQERSSTLLIDAGALFFPKPDIPAGLQYEQARVTARGIAEIYRNIGYEAIGIAGRDLAAGLDFLHDLAERSDHPWLSANLVGKQDGKPLFSPYTILKKEEITVGLIGLTDPDKAPSGDKNADILTWQEVLPGVLADIRDKCDLIVLLSNLKEKENQKISSQYPEIKIIIQSGQGKENLKPHLYNNTLICQTADQGKYLGEMEITWDSSGKWSRPESPDLLLNKKSELDRLKWQLKSMRKKGDPKEVYRNRPEMLNRFHDLQKRRKSLNKEISRLQESKEQKKRKAEWDNTFWALSDKVAEDRDTAELINKIKSQKTELARQVKTTHDLPDYSGSKSCRKCHRQIFTAWSKTPHAKAWSTLKEKKENYNPKCLSCHVTGFSEEPGMQALSLPASLRNVGCESCHGPGSRHAEDPGTANIDRRPTAGICLKCHQPEHDDSFNFEEDKLSVHQEK